MKYEDVMENNEVCGRDGEVRNVGNYLDRTECKL